MSTNHSTHFSVHLPINELLFYRFIKKNFKPIPVKIVPCARLIILDDFSFCNSFSPKFPANIAIIENTTRVIP